MILREIIFSKKTIVMSLICLLFLSFTFSLKANAIDEDYERAGCDFFTIKIFGFKILKKYNRDCTNPIDIPDGRWDWFPN